MKDITNVQNLGGLPPFFFDPDSRDPLPAADAVAWYLPIDPPVEKKGSWEAKFERFLESVDASQVRVLIVDNARFQYQGLPLMEPVAGILAAADRLTSLEGVFVGTEDQGGITEIEPDDVTALLTTFPGLLEFGVRTAFELNFPTVRHEKLRSLTVEVGGDLAATLPLGILGSDLPSLEKLELWLGTDWHGDDVEVDHLAPLLSGETFPALRHLGLRDSAVHNDLAAALASAPVVPRLRVLDLSRGDLADDGAGSLLGGQPLTHLERLDLHHHSMTEEMARRVVDSLAPHGVDVDVSGRQEPREDYRYGVPRTDALLGLPAVDFDPEATASLPAAGGVAWRISVDDFSEEEESWEANFRAFLEAVDVGKVRALIIGKWDEPFDSTSAEPIGHLVAAADRFTSLEAVFVGDMEQEEAEISWIQQSDVTTLLAAFPGLIELGVRGGTCLEFPAVKHEGLRALTVEAGGLPRDVVLGIAGSELPALEKLELWLGVGQYGGDARVGDLAPLLSGEVFPSLRHLGLRNSEFQDEIATALASAPVVARLRTLDLSLGTLGDEGATALLEGQPLTHLERLDLHHHFLTEEMRQRITDAFVSHAVLVDVSQRRTPWDEDGEDQEDGYDGRYTMVSE